MMSIFSSEIARKLRGEKYNFAIENSVISVSLKCGKIVKINADGGLYFDRFFTDNERAEYFALARLVAEISEYVSDFENGKSNGEFRVILVHNSMVLSAKYNEKDGFEFATFLRGENGKIIAENRFNDYAKAKENFAVRAGLICGEKAFYGDDANALCYCVCFTLEFNDALNKDTRNLLENLKQKLDGDCEKIFAGKEENHEN